MELLHLLLEEEGQQRGISCGTNSAGGAQSARVCYLESVSVLNMKRGRCHQCQVTKTEHPHHTSFACGEKQGVITDLSGIPWLFLPRALARLCAEPNLRGYRKRRWNGVLVRHGTPGVAPALCLVQADVVFTVHIVKIISLNRPITVTGDSFLIVRRGNGV